MAQRAEGAYSNYRFPFRTPQPSFLLSPIICKDINPKKSHHNTGIVCIMPERGRGILGQEATHPIHIPAPKGLAFPKWICGNKGSRSPKRPKTMLPHLAEPRETWPGAFSLNGLVSLGQASRTCSLSIKG